MVFKLLQEVRAFDLPPLRHPEFRMAVHRASDRPHAIGHQLAFTILRDGSVEDVSWIQRSGSAAFDLEARGSIETAGLRQAFGPLPDGYPSDQLRVSFFFDPTRY